MCISAKASKYEDAVVNVTSELGNFDWGRDPSKTSSFESSDKGRLVTSHVRSWICLGDPICETYGFEKVAKERRLPPHIEFLRVSSSMLGLSRPLSSTGHSGKLSKLYMLVSWSIYSMAFSASHASHV